MCAASASPGRKHHTDKRNECDNSTYLQILNLINGAKIKTIASARSEAFLALAVLPEASLSWLLFLLLLFDDSRPSRLWSLLLIAFQYFLRFGLWTDNNGKRSGCKGIGFWFDWIKDCWEYLPESSGIWPLGSPPGFYSCPVRQTNPACSCSAGLRHVFPRRVWMWAVGGSEENIGWGN